MTYRFLQANINHSARAQDLLMQTLAEWNIGLAVVTEPYLVPDRTNWHESSDGSVAITAANGPGAPPLTIMGGGAGYAAVKWGELTLVGVYFSPNKSLAEFETFFDRVAAVVIGLSPGQIVVAGDLNAKSALWGSPVTDPRGVALGDWAGGLGLLIINKGSARTCIRREGGSVIDVTFATPSVTRKVRDWWVEEEVETLSDYLYVRMDLSTSISSPQGAALQEGRHPR